MLESFILIATLTLQNGDVIEAVGEEYPTYQMCVKDNEREMREIQSDIRRNPRVFRDMTFRCEHLLVVYPKGVSIND